MTVEIPMKLWACKGCLDYGRTFGARRDFCSRCGGLLVHRDMTFVLSEQDTIHSPGERP